MVLLLIAFSASCASAIEVFIEAEDYVASHDAGGVSIYVTACSAARGGLAVEGYDYPGDWIELRVVLPVGGAYADMFRSAGDDLVASDHKLTVRAEGGDDLAFSGYHTVGMGVG